MHDKRAFSLVEVLVVLAMIAMMAIIAVPAVRAAYRSTSLAVSANNVRQLSAGGMAYLADNNYRFWPYLKKTSDGDFYWFGFEPAASRGKTEGSRQIDMQKGPLGQYLPRNFAPDPSFAFTGKPFKPKFKFGYIGFGYNVVLANSWATTPTGKQPSSYHELQHPESVVVFATSAQVYPFQKEAVIEEFYGIDQKEVTVHFRHNGQAMVAFADGSVGFLPMDPSTLDRRAPDARVGRFAPKGSFKYLR